MLVAAGVIVEAVPTEPLQDNDAHLVRIAVAGDVRAFAELVTRYKQRVFHLAARFTRSDHELDDLACEPRDRWVDAQLAAVEARSVVMWAVARLVITLMELEEKSVKDIAGLTGWTEVNVKIRARQALQRILEETGHER